MALLDLNSTSRHCSASAKYMQIYIASLTALGPLLALLCRELIFRERLMTCEDAFLKLLAVASSRSAEMSPAIGGGRKRGQLGSVRKIDMNSSAYVCLTTVRQYCMTHIIHFSANLLRRHIPIHRITLLKHRHMKHNSPLSPPSLSLALAAAGVKKEPRRRNTLCLRPSSFFGTGGGLRCKNRKLTSVASSKHVSNIHQIASKQHYSTQTHKHKTHPTALRDWWASSSNSTSMMRCRHSEYKWRLFAMSLFTLNSEMERRSCFSAPSALVVCTEGRKGVEFE